MWINRGSEIWNLSQEKRYWKVLLRSLSATWPPSRKDVLSVRDAANSKPSIPAFQVRGTSPLSLSCASCNSTASIFACAIWCNEHLWVVLQGITFCKGCASLGVRTSEWRVHCVDVWASSGPSASWLRASWHLSNYCSSSWWNRDKCRKHTISIGK